jgi:hypothetical protein
MVNLRVIHTVPPRPTILAQPQPEADIALWNHSLKLWPTNEVMRYKWLAAVFYLRNISKKGWVIDTRVMKY